VLNLFSNRHMNSSPVSTYSVVGVWDVDTNTHTGGRRRRRGFSRWGSDRDDAVEHGRDGSVFRDRLDWPVLPRRHHIRHQDTISQRCLASDQL